MMRVAFEEMPWETAGDGLAIAAGEAEKHRPRALTERVRMIFVEDSREDSSLCVRA
jgi:hypothetical protein